MSTITADSAMGSILSQIKDVTEIRDGRGNLLGIYTPKEKADAEIKKLFDVKRAHETLARERDQGRPLREILDRLEATENKE